jgi:hypothetical protein
MSVLVVCGDLIFTTKITGTAQALGLIARVVPNGDSVAGNSEVSKLIVDLNAGGTSREQLERMREEFPTPTTLIAFGSHVDVDRLRDARQAAFDRVMPRSEFSARLVELLNSSNEPISG